jgi:aspartate/methionine/tyrosine aminotransferase
MNRLAKRVQQMETTIFSVISQMATDFNAINLGQGFPDFNGPEWLIQETQHAMQAGYNQYAPLMGVAPLRNVLASIYKNRYHLSYNPLTEITVTSGATEAIFDSIFGLVDPQDEVILFEPYYDSYKACVELAGGKPIFIPLRSPSFTFDPSELKAAITPHTKLIVVNTPHNPTGKVFSQDELITIASYAIEHNLTVLSDEVYEYMTFDGISHHAIASIPNMRERTITISSTGKTFGMTGWKIGWACAPQALTQAVRRTHQFVTYATATPFQYGMAYALEQLSSYVPEMRKMYQEKRDLLFRGLEELGFEPIKPGGTYFIVAGYANHSTKKAFDFSSELIKEAGVATIPLSVFYSQSKEGRQYIRFCFAKEHRTLQIALEKLQRWIG